MDREAREMFKTRTVKRPLLCLPSRPGLPRGRGPAPCRRGDARRSSIKRRFFSRAREREGERLQRRAHLRDARLVGARSSPGNRHLSLDGAMAKYGGVGGERISGRPSYRSHRQAYWPSASASPSDGCPPEGRPARLGTLGERDPVYPRSLAEEVVWRQRRFAWWGTTYLVDPVSVPPALPSNPAHLKALRLVRNKDVSSRSLLPFNRTAAQRNSPGVIGPLSEGDPL